MIRREDGVYTWLGSEATRLPVEVAVTKYILRRQRKLSIKGKPRIFHTQTWRADRDPTIDIDWDVVYMPLMDSHTFCWVTRRKFL